MKAALDVQTVQKKIDQAARLNEEPKETLNSVHSNMKTYIKKRTRSDEDGVKCFF